MLGLFKYRDGRREYHEVPASLPKIWNLALAFQRPFSLADLSSNVVPELSVTYVSFYLRRFQDGSFEYEE